MPSDASPEISFWGFLFYDAINKSEFTAANMKMIDEVDGITQNIIPAFTWRGRRKPRKS
jgi:hypothetical protein